ncbi:asparaginase [Jonesia denitrificans]|uniref:L-asparaginase II n=1 Tax=Jonesia denitrificans (strain ATCC 14870 / DSM 20603 / BCRC 15368 / CIP 55.134 / JCM 11481 / NBRC 15587 / NCTC 10816 / Prevot 55134) TaxID=471856 RepID=C7R3V3_JONDD|nr:asparaginase [Jonesia denitrificans]ACV08810.1 L-asparaginase II [Jonesia denitrificans DSM 20603]SQH20799.1 L-asparaginase II [Jonesia denitrificans]
MTQPPQPNPVHPLSHQAHEPLVALVRSGLVESVHYGSWIALDSTGETITSAGDPDALIYPRSALKPLQAFALLTAGWDGTLEQVALACASHSGTSRHCDVVTSTLRDAHLTIDALRNTPDLPLGQNERTEAIRASATPTSLAQNCSGKHAAMLATCVHNRWDLDSYLDPTHPLQQHIRTTIESFTGEPITITSVDGCGAPLFAMTLRALAHAFTTLATKAHTDSRSPAANIITAMTTHPTLVAGPGRDVTDMMVAFPGLVTKDGAEGIHIAVFPDSRVAALKIADGTNRGRVTAALHLLGELGAHDPQLTLAHTPAVLGGGQPVGHTYIIPARDTTTTRQ